jgi:hypothetical protein
VGTGHDVHVVWYDSDVRAGGNSKIVTSIVGIDVIAGISRAAGGKHVANLDGASTNFTMNKRRHQHLGAVETASARLITDQ